MATADENSIIHAAEYENSKPIIKWVGGKSQILDEVLAQFPIDIDNYYELFIGGGSVLLGLLSRMKEGDIKVRGRIFAFDANEALIGMYNNIKRNCDALYKELKKMIDVFLACPNPEKSGGRSKLVVASNEDDAKVSREAYYYWIRAQYNASSDKNAVRTSAMFIFLNKTCFRGVYRVGPKGFNVPYGFYANPEIINKDHLDEISVLIKNVHFRVADFRDSMNLIIANKKDSDFVYMDPPYYPEDAKSFVGYTKDGFDEDSHTKFFELCHSMTDKKIRWLMSNSDVPALNLQFGNEMRGSIYHIEKIKCKRSINSKKPASTTMEVLIWNF